MTCENCNKKSECYKKETFALTFDQAVGVVIDAFAEKPVEEATQILEGTSQLVDMKTLFPEGEPPALTDAKDFCQYFENKKVVEER